MLIEAVLYDMWFGAEEELIKAEHVRAGKRRGVLMRKIRSGALHICRSCYCCIPMAANYQLRPDVFFSSLTSSSESPVSSEINEISMLSVFCHVPYTPNASAASFMAWAIGRACGHFSSQSLQPTQSEAWKPSPSQSMYSILVLGFCS